MNAIEETESTKYCDLFDSPDSCIRISCENCEFFIKESENK